MIQACFALVLVPLAFVLPGNTSSVTKDNEQKLSAALSEALAHRGFVLLTTGFFVCGFFETSSFCGFSLIADSNNSTFQFIFLFQRINLQSMYSKFSFRN